MKTMRNSRHVHLKAASAFARRSPTTNKQMQARAIHIHRSMAERKGRSLSAMAAAQQGKKEVKDAKEVNPINMLADSKPARQQLEQSAIETDKPMPFPAYDLAAQNEGSAKEPTEWRNVDGERIDDGRYAAFAADIQQLAGVPEERCFDDALTTFAYGTDASCYRLNPKLVVKVWNEDEVRKILPIAVKHQVPVTFRAAGTSLSGQAITDSVLLKLSHNGKYWRNLDIKDNGREITVEPGMIGGEVNRALAAYKQRNPHIDTQYKIGPDPASIDSCMMGGIVSNNSSGMCCGVKQNSYHTIKDMRVVFADGSLLDTSDPHSWTEWAASHQPLVQGLTRLAAQVQADEELCALIKRKFAIKCTTGYSLNALIDFPPEEPMEIIKHVLVGSEGTLGFVSEVTYATVPELPHKASAFMVFPSIEAACAAAYVLREKTPVDAVELFDYAALTVASEDESMQQLVSGIDTAGAEDCAALLIECRGQDQSDLARCIERVNQALVDVGIPFRDGEDVHTNTFTADPSEFNVYWDMRKGLIPLVGGARTPGMSFLIEDVACEVKNLAAMTRELQQMFEKYNYPDACIIGHALEGNLHLLFAQDFRTPEDVAQFKGMMNEMCEIVADKYKGSLKGEHSTGRNISPFVEKEWGERAYEAMWEVKLLFDPEFMLNPGVILTFDEEMHLRHLKHSPPTHSSGTSHLIDRCIECGFCESNCPSKDLTLTPRQRITVFREINRLQDLGDKRSSQDSQRLVELREGFHYNAEATCAADGMCQEKCPVKINTGALIKTLRHEQYGYQTDGDGVVDGVQNGARGFGAGLSLSAAWSMGKNFGTFVTATKALLGLLDAAHAVFGPNVIGGLGTAAHKAGTLTDTTNGLLPLWNKYIPQPAVPLAPIPSPLSTEPHIAAKNIPREVVYFPSCVTRMMGPARGDDDADGAAVHDKMLSLLQKAGYSVIVPELVQGLCCGMLFKSRGLGEVGDYKGEELEHALMKASQGGKLPILCDTSPCLASIKDELRHSEMNFSLYEPLQFTELFLLDKLDFKKVKDEVVVHVPCSSKKQKLDDTFVRLASKCAEQVHVSGVPCCGSAGDRGLRYPELTNASLTHLPDLPISCGDGYSTSRTCEVSLSNASGFHYRSLVYLLDEASSSRERTVA